MKSQKLSVVILILLLAVKFPFASSSDESGLKKNFHQEYNCSKSSSLVIENKYGKVNVRKWNKDVVSIDVVISVNTTKPEKAQKVFDHIKISFSNVAEVIKAITSIEGEFGRINFSIDYTIDAPSYLRLDISDKFGDIFIDEAENVVNLNIEYGNLKINKLLWDNAKPLSEVKMSYSKGDIGECGLTKLTLKYSELNIENSKVLMAVTRFSTLNDKNGFSLITDSKYDTYQIGNLNSFIFTGEFTNTDISKVTDKIESETKYGGLNIDDVSAGFASVSVRNKFGNISIGISNAASYKLNAKMQYCDIKYPASKNTRESGDDLRKSISGTVGSNFSPSSVVDIESAYGDVDLNK